MGILRRARASAARIDFVYLVSSMHSLDFPQDSGPAVVKTKKPLESPTGALLAIQDEAWGKWLPPEVSQQHQDAAVNEEPDLMASFASFRAP